MDSFEADLTWLLHRAAQRTRAAMEEECLRQGLDLRSYLVLTALETRPGWTQLELGQAIGIDKTTMTTLLDKLEGRELLERRSSPGDRRARIPVSTARGRALQKKIARGIVGVEEKLLSSFSKSEQRMLRSMLTLLIGDESLAGSCV